MSTRRFTEDHEWVVVEGDIAVVGISNYAQSQLGDIVFVELPQPGKIFTRGDEAAVIESVKAASEVYCPISGTVTEINEALSAEPGIVNSSPLDNGWLFKLRISSLAEIESLMDENAYQSLLSESN